MFLAGVGLGQLLAVFGAIGAIVVALYLLDRSRRRLVVASLQFWQSALQPLPQRRWRIREPLSLLLQLLGILLLLLAFGQLRVGSAPDTPRDHVLLLDTSAWMASRSDGGNLMDEATETALAYVRALPADDRVMVVRAGSPPLAVTGFETDREVIEEAILGLGPDPHPLDIAQAIEAAARIRSAHARRAGEIVYVGAGRTAGEGASESIPAGFRHLLVGEDRAIENAGLQRIGLRHSADDAREWNVFVAVRNHGSAPRDLQVSVQFAGAPAAYREMRLDGGGEEEISFPLRSRAAGILEVRLFPDDDLPADNDATVRLPARQPARVAVYSWEPGRWREVLAASPMVEADYREPGTAPDGEADFYLVDRCDPGFRPDENAIWIMPPEGVSPVELGRTLRTTEILRWDRTHPATAGLRTQDLSLEEARILTPGDSDRVIAETAEGAVAIARAPGIVVFGFDPLAAGTRYELAAPLLIAGTIRWVTPDVFRQWELTAGPPGTISVPLPEEVPAEDIRVAYDDAEELPFQLSDGSLRFYAGRAGIVRITTPNRDLVYSLNLPSVAGNRWVPPEGTARGVPGASATEGSYAEVWYWLALAGALCLVYEWHRFGRRRAAGARGTL